VQVRHNASTERIPRAAGKKGQPVMAENLIVRSEETYPPGG
jgi:hypothetical protein